MTNEKTEFRSTCNNLHGVCVIAEDRGDQILTLAE